MKRLIPTLLFSLLSLTVFAQDRVDIKIHPSDSEAFSQLFKGLATSSTAANPLNGAWLMHSTSFTTEKEIFGLECTTHNSDPTKTQCIVKIDFTKHAEGIQAFVYRHGIAIVTFKDPQVTSHFNQNMRGQISYTTKEKPRVQIQCVIGARQPGSTDLCWLEADVQMTGEPK